VTAPHESWNCLNVGRRSLQQRRQILSQVLEAPVRLLDLGGQRHRLLPTAASRLLGEHGQASTPDMVSVPDRKLCLLLGSSKGHRGSTIGA